MGMFDFLTGTPSTAETVSTLNPQQKKASKDIYSYLSNLGWGNTPYAGKLTADIPSLFTDAYDALSPSVNEAFSAARAALSRDLAGTPAYQFNPEELQSQWSKNYASPVMETWKRTVLPMVREGYNSVAGGAYSLANARGTESAANQFYSENVMPQFYNAYLQGTQADVASREAAAARVAPAASMVAGMPGQQFGVLSSAALQKYGLDTNAINAALQEFERTSPENSQKLKLLLQFMGIPTTETAVIQGTEGSMGTLLGAGAGGLIGGAALTGGGLGFTAEGALLGALAMSDKRLKRNIKPLGPALKAVSKLKAYTYNFKDSDDIRVGLMAQDVERVLPWAVKNIDGSKRVDIYAVEALLVDAVNELNTVNKRRAA